MAVESPVSHEFLAGQRRRIYQRLERTGPNRTALRWALSFAMLLLMVVGITVERRRQSPPPISDEQLFPISLPSSRAPSRKPSADSQPVQQ